MVVFKEVFTKVFTEDSQVSLKKYSTEQNYHLTLQDEI